MSSQIYSINNFLNLGEKGLLIAISDINGSVDCLPSDNFHFKNKAPWTAFLNLDELEILNYDIHIYE